MGVTCIVEYWDALYRVFYRIFWKRNDDFFGFVQVFWFVWLVADGLDKNSVRLDKTLRNWIGSMDEAQRKQFVNVLFSIASDSNFENLDQMSFKQLIEMIKAADELSKADWSMLKDTVRLLISAGVGVVRDEKEK